jgi:hypothetical protein
MSPSHGLVGEESWIGRKGLMYIVVDVEGWDSHAYWHWEKCES